jgi:hypothetical protein
MGCHGRSQRLAQAGMRQDAMVRHLQQRQWLAARMAIRAKVAASKPAAVGAIRSGTKVRAGVDRASASSHEGDEGRWRAGRLEAGIGSLPTGLA